MADTKDDEQEGARETRALDDEDRAGLVGRIQRAWRETVGNYATDEGETKNLMKRLVDFGTLTRDESAQVLTDFRKRIEQNRKELDRRVDESLRRATDRLTIPSPAELDRLRARVKELEQRVERALDERP